MGINSLVSVVESMSREFAGSISGLGTFFH